MTTEMVKRVERAVRDEIVRQYRDDERGKCPAGAHYYEENIGPHEIARVALAAIREPTLEMVRAGARALKANINSNFLVAVQRVHEAGIDAALAD